MTLVPGWQPGYPGGFGSAVCQFLAVLVPSWKPSQNCHVKIGSKKTPNNVSSSRSSGKSKKKKKANSKAERADGCGWSLDKKDPQWVNSQFYESVKTYAMENHRENEYEHFSDFSKNKVHKK